MTIECDEAWSFVGNQGRKQWLWLTINRDAREIIGIHIEERSGASAQALWDALPPVYRQCAVCYSDFWEAAQTAWPTK